MFSVFFKGMLNVEKKKIWMRVAAAFFCWNSLWMSPGVKIKRTRLTQGRFLINNNNNNNNVLFETWLSLSSQLTLLLRTIRTSHSLQLRAHHVSPSWALVMSDAPASTWPPRARSFTAAPDGIYIFTIWHLQGEETGRMDPPELGAQVRRRQIVLLFLKCCQAEHGGNLLSSSGVADTCLKHILQDLNLRESYMQDQLYEVRHPSLLYVLWWLQVNV